MLKHKSESHFFYCWIIFHSLSISHFPYSFFCWQHWLVSTLAIVNKAAMNICIIIPILRSRRRGTEEVFYFLKSYNLFCQLKEQERNEKTNYINRTVHLRLLQARHQASLSAVYSTISGHWTSSWMSLRVHFTHYKSMLRPHLGSRRKVTTMRQEWLPWAHMSHRASPNSFFSPLETSILHQNHWNFRPAHTTIHMIKSDSVRKRASETVKRFTNVRRWWHHLCRTVNSETMTGNSNPLSPH